MTFEQQQAEADKRNSDAVDANDGEELLERYWVVRDKLMQVPRARLTMQERRHISERNCIERELLGLVRCLLWGMLEQFAAAPPPPTAMQDLEAQLRRAIIVAEAGFPGIAEWLQSKVPDIDFDKLNCGEVQ